MTIYRQRLLNVARALREAPRPEQFYMGAFARPCGSPACALGHYAARTDMDQPFSLGADSCLWFEGRWVSSLALFNRLIPEHFGITSREADQLFYGDGCGRAQTPEQAIAYIENFVEKKWPTDIVPLP